MSILKSPDMQTRLLYTLGAIALYRIGREIPLPGVDMKLISDVMRPHTSLTLFSLGIYPYLSGAFLVLLLSAAVPSLRRLRDGSTEDNRRFDMFIYLAAALITVFQAWGLTARLNVMSMGDQPLAVTGLSFEIIGVVFIAAGTMLLVWIADLITQRGIVNGVALFVVMGTASDLGPFVKSLLTASSTGKATTGTVWLVSLIPIALVALSCLLVLAKRTIPVERIDGQKNSADLSSVPVRLMGSGVMPAVFALSVMFLPTTIFTFFPNNESIQEISRKYFSYTSPTYMLVYAALTFVFTYIFAAVIYDPKDLVARLKRYGYAIAGMNSDKEAEEHVDAIILRTVWLAALFLIVLEVLPRIVFSAFGIREQSLLSNSLLIVSAVCLSAVQYLFVKADRPDWLPVFSGETLMDAQFVNQILHDANIDAAVFSNRVVPMTGSLGVWEVCRPKYPSIIMHRRLGQGTVEVLVPPDQVDRARSLLSSQQLL